MVLRNLCLLELLVKDAVSSVDFYKCIFADFDQFGPEPLKAALYILERREEPAISLLE